jgi:pantoate--beta-alanine ligase
MQTFSQPEPLRRAIAAGRAAGHRIAFVPTMGALHAGHRACIDVARGVENARVVCSIFVNPTQFAPGEDLDRYPRSLDSDLAHLREWGCDIAFVPDTRVMYPVAQNTWVTVDGVTDVMCGPFRPGHFRGVATVVAKLFHMVTPDVAVFGQKDAQQAIVIRRTIEGLALPVEMRLARTVRDADGLAISSRNAYLSASERTHATGIRRALDRAAGRLVAGTRDPRAVEGAARDALRDAGIDRIDYVELRDARDLSALERVEGRVILAIAAWVGPTRLIDNMVFDVDGGAIGVDVALF